MPSGRSFIWFQLKSLKETEVKRLINESQNKPNAVITLHLAMNPHNLRAFHAYFKFFLHQQDKYQSYLLVLSESTQ